MKKLIALILAAVIALSLSHAAFTTAYAASDGGADHYRYSWDYLKNYLLSEGHNLDLPPVLHGKLQHKRNGNRARRADGYQ